MTIGLHLFNQTSYMCPQDWRVETLFLSLSLSLLFHLTLIMKPQNTCRFPKVVYHVPPPGSMHLSPGMLTFMEEGLILVSNNNRKSPPIIYYARKLYCTLSVIVPHIWVERISFYISLDVQLKHPRWTQSHVGLGIQWGPNVVFADENDNAMLLHDYYY